MRRSFERWLAGLCVLLFGWPCESLRAQSADTGLTRSARRFDPPPQSFASALLMPFYIPERVMRHVMLPVERGVWVVEEYHLIDRVEDLLSDDTGRIWFYPGADYSSSDGFALGGTFSFSDIAYRSYHLNAKARVYLNLDYRASLRFGRASAVYRPFYYSLSVSGSRNANASFYGPGIDTTLDDKGKYWRDVGHVTAKLGYRFPRLRFLKVSLVARGELASTRSTRPGETHPDVDELLPPEDIPGFGRDIATIYFGGEFKFDSRIPKGHARRGFLLAGRVLRAEDTHGRYSHWRWRLKTGTVINLYRQTRVLALGLRLEGIEGGDAPFFRLPRLDRHTPLRGFSAGRYRDRHTAVTNVEYRFPLWHALRPHPTFALGTLFVDVGKPFAQYAELAEARVLWATGVGIVLSTEESTLLRAQIGYGGEGFESIVALGRAF